MPNNDYDPCEDPRTDDGALAVLCEYDGFPTPVAQYGSHRSLHDGMYIGFFHGRRSLDDEMHDWGFNGPVFGPLAYAHTTYMCPPVLTLFSGDHVELEAAEGCIKVGPYFYGDFTVFMHKNGQYE